jgi:hypothetical protein
LTIDADALRHDDQKQITLFTGRVTANKGTIAMRGARLEVRQDVQGNQFGILTADPGSAPISGKSARAWTSSSRVRPSRSNTTAQPTPCACAQGRTAPLPGRNHCRRGPAA